MPPGSSLTFLSLILSSHVPSEARVEFWLQSLKTRVPNADVVIVGTHAEDPSLGPIEKTVPPLSCQTSVFS